MEKTEPGLGPEIKTVTREVRPMAPATSEGDTEVSPPPLPEIEVKPESVVTNPSESLSPENRSSLSEMSEGGRGVFTKMYEGIYHIPAVNRLVGKIEIAYNQFWVDRHEEKALKFKDKADEAGAKVEDLDKSKAELEAVIGDLAAKNIPGVGSLQLKLKVIDQQRTNLINEKESAVRKYEIRAGKANMYATERDLVADMLIGVYDKKLEPTSKKLEDLQTKKDQLDLVIAATGAKHEEQLVKLKELEDNKKAIETALLRTGMSQSAVSKFGAVKALAECIESGREKIRDEKVNLSERAAIINLRILKANEKASPYREKKQRLVNLKSGKRMVPNNGGETNSSVDGENVPDDESLHDDEGGDAGGAENLKEVTHFKTYEFVDGWNNYLTQKDPAEKLRSGVDLASFLKATGLSKDNMLDFKNFENILIKYYKSTKIYSLKLEATIKSFIREKQAVK